MANRSKESAELKALREQNAQLMARLDQMAQYQATLTASAGAHRAPAGQLMVGIRNVSNYTVGLRDTSGPVPVEYTLHADVPGELNPHNRAAISYVFWQSLRRGPNVAKGLIVRDDAVLGPADNVAPPDRPEDVHPDAQRNLVLHPREWILSRSEEQLRADIEAMTSEPSLRRLMFVVDQEIWRIGEERYADHPNRPELAIRDLPSVFRLVEELGDARLDALNPVSKVRHLELAPRPRAARA